MFDDSPADVEFPPGLRRAAAADRLGHQRPRVRGRTGRRTAVVAVGGLPARGRRCEPSSSSTSMMSLTAFEASYITARLARRWRRYSVPARSGRARSWLPASAGTLRRMAGGVVAVGLEGEAAGFGCTSGAGSTFVSSVAKRKTVSPTWMRSPVFNAGAGGAAVVQERAVAAAEIDERDLFAGGVEFAMPAGCARVVDGNGVAGMPADHRDAGSEFVPRSDARPVEDHQSRHGSSRNQDPTRSACADHPHRSGEGLVEPPA